LSRRRFNVKEAEAVLIEVRDGVLVIKPVRKKLKLADLLANYKPHHRHGETDWGDKRGKEEW
jgi:antitoxin component of MazEF toxin-antitoxin module